MSELLRSNDLVLLSYVAHVLDEAGVEHFVFDAHTSAVEGSIGVLPRRVMVNDDDLKFAQSLLRNESITFSG